MSSIKNLIPILILLALSIYGYQKYDHLPQVILNGIIFLPIVLAVLVISLSIHFNRSSVFFYVVLVATANIVLGLELAQTSLSHALLSSLLPLLLLVFTVLPDRGIISIRAIPAYAILFSAIVFSVITTNMSPEWLLHILLTDWLPGRYFDWTQQSQTVLFISITVFMSMLVLYFLRPSPHMSAGLGVLIMLIAPASSR
jgi:hypothetical protein